MEWVIYTLLCVLYVFGVFGVIESVYSHFGCLVKLGLPQEGLPPGIVSIRLLSVD